jgi:hypothetical protein
LEPQGVARKYKLERTDISLDVKQGPVTIVKVRRLGMLCLNVCIAENT